MERYWELDKFSKAWIIALIETKETLQEVVDYVDGLDEK